MIQQFFDHVKRKMEKFQYCLSYSCDTFSHPLRVTHARKLTEILLSWWGKRSFWNITVVSMTIYLYHVVPHFRETQNKFFLGCSTLQEKKIILHYTWDFFMERKCCLFIMQPIHLPSLNRESRVRDQRKICRKMWFYKEFSTLWKHTNTHL